MELKDVADLATVVGAPLAIAALVFTALQLKRTLLVEQGRFLLELERMSTDHNKIHLRLRPGGDWADGKTLPNSPAEWAELEEYMGFFEHCELLIQSGSLDASSFARLFGYRVKNIVANDSIVQTKLVDEGKHWKDFRSLASRLGLQLPTVAS